MVSYPNQVSGPETISGSSATGLLTIDNTSTVTGALNGDLELIENASTSTAIGISVNGDTNNRHTVTGAGALAWGPGNGATDTNLSRTGVGTLTATGLTVTNALSVGAGAIITGIANTNGGTNTVISAPVLTPTLSSGTAAQLSDTTRDYMIYMNITTSGTATHIEIGPTSTPANTFLASASVTAGTVYSFRLPASWYIKWTGTTTALSTLAVGC